MSKAYKPIVVGDQQVPADTAAPSQATEHSLSRLQKVMDLLMDLPSYDLAKQLFQEVR